MKKRIFSMLLALCLVLMLVPTTAFAAQTKYDLLIGDASFTSSKKTITVGSGTATFDPDNSKLTLNNITLSYGAAQTAALQLNIPNLQIELIGTNTINITNDKMVAIWFMAAGNSTITGTSGSKLVINSVGQYNMGITTNENVNLTITNTTLTINDNTTDKAKQGYMVGIKPNGNFTMTGGSYTAKGVQSGVEMYTDCVANLSGVNFNITCTPRQSFDNTKPNEMSIGLNMAPLTGSKQNVITNCSGSISAHAPLYIDGNTVLSSSNNLKLTTDVYNAVYVNAKDSGLTVSGGTLSLSSTGSAANGFFILKNSKLVFDASPNVTVDVSYVAVFLNGDDASAQMKSGTVNTTAKAGVLLNNAGNTFTLSGGTLNMTPRAGEAQTVGIQTYGTVNITGGSLKTTGEMYSAIQNAGGKSISISGGTHTLSSTASDSAGYLDTANGTLNISGTADVTFSGWSTGINLLGKLNQSGGKLTTGSTTTYGIDNSGTLNLTGGTTAVNTTYVGIHLPGALNQSGGTLTVSKAVQYDIDMSGTLSLSGGTLTLSDGYDSVYTTGTMNLTGGKLNLSGTRVGILTGDGGQVKFAGTDATLVGGTAGWGKTSGSGSYSVTGGKVVLQGSSYAASTIYSSLANGYRVYAGSSESNAALIGSPTHETFTGNQYVRIEAGTAPVAVTGVTIDETLSLTIGQTKTPSFTVMPAEAANKTVSFTSDNTAVATVHASTGAVTGVSAGTATITIKTADGNFTDTCKVTVSCGHANKTAVPAQTSTCKVKGWEAYSKCNDCGQLFDKNGNPISGIPYLPLASHTESGWKTDAGGHWKECTVCGNTTTMKAAHIPGAAATETTPQTCTVCGYVITPAQGHTHSLTMVEAKAPTCTEDGNIAYYKCSGCGKLYADAAGKVELAASEVVEKATGHQYEWVIDKEATATEKGSKHEECTVCHDKKAAVDIPALGDNTDELQALLNAGGIVKLNKDYTITSTLNVTKTVTLDLNGHTIRMTGSGSVIEIASGGNLTVKDSNPTATHTGYDSLPDGGVITGGNATQGGGVYVYYGSFIMEGGTIYHCSATSGGGVYVSYGGDSFTMKGGTIRNCRAEAGGGAYVSSDSRITMTGGTIRDCTATSSNSDKGGGGVLVSRGSFTMRGGTIEDCSAVKWGGGVYCKNSGSFEMSGGAIQNCGAASGGGLRLDDSSFTMTGGIMEACTASGSGDAVSTSGAVNLLANGGVVKGTVSLGSKGTIQTTNASGGCTVFYDEVKNNGTISGGIYYGGIEGSGTVTGTYYQVNFELNGGSGAAPTQRFFHTDTAKALRPADPTRDGYAFLGWYNGDIKYDFTEAVTKNMTLTAKWVLTNVSTESELKEALNAGAASIKLVGDFKLSGTLDLTDKEITLDLNGHTLTGDIKLADTSAAPKSILTLIDSSSDGSGVIKGSITLTRGNGSVSHLYANGGTVTGMVSLPSYAGGIFCTSDTPTAFKGYVGNYGEIHGGIFYGDVKESCIKEKTVTFVSDGSRYALEVVAAGGRITAPAAPKKEGYIFAGWDQKIPDTMPAENLTFTAKWEPIALVGDVNGDGKITVTDLMCLANYFAGKAEINKTNSDLDGDGRVTVTDLMRLANYFAGKETLG